jgi:hypothetical protein
MSFSENIPEPELHLPSRDQVRVCYKSLLQRWIKLVSRRIACQCNRPGLEITRDSSKFPNAPMAVDQVAQVYDINAQLYSIICFPFPAFVS